MKSEQYVSESGHSLEYLAREGHYYRLLLYFEGLLVFSRQYDWHQSHQAERERDALVKLGNLAQK